MGQAGICQCDLERYRFTAAWVVLSFAAAGCSSSSGPDAAVVRLTGQLADRDGVETGRRTVELMALTLEGALLVRQAPRGRRRVLPQPPRRRLGPRLGTLLASTAFGAAADRALPGSGVSSPRLV